MTSGGVFVLVFFLVSGLYVIGFAAYNYKVKGLRGREMAPHPQFWGAIPGLVKDGCIFTFRTIRGLVSGGSTTYSNV